MADNVTIQLNMTNGEILIQAPSESLDTIFDKLESFLPKLSEVHNKYAPEPTEGESLGLTTNTEPQSPADTTEHTDLPAKVVTKRKHAASTKKAESFNMVDLGLDEQHRNALRTFYAEKNPKSQNEQLLVIMAWLKEHAGKVAVTKDEIYTALRTVDVKIPARISSVLSNLAIEGRITSDTDGYRIHHTGEDLVKFNLPKKDGQK